MVLLFSEWVGGGRRARPGAAEPGGPRGLGLAALALRAQELPLPVAVEGARVGDGTRAPQHEPEADAHGRAVDQRGAGYACRPGREDRDGFGWDGVPRGEQRVHGSHPRVDRTERREGCRERPPREASAEGAESRRSMRPGERSRPFDGCRALRRGEEARSGQSSPRRRSDAGVGATARRCAEGSGHRTRRRDSCERGAERRDAGADAVHHHGDLLSTSDAKRDASAVVMPTSSEFTEIIAARALPTGDGATLG
jgi:hypothetical protein